MVYGVRYKNLKNNKIYMSLFYNKDDAQECYYCMEDVLWNQGNKELLNRFHKLSIYESIMPDYLAHGEKFDKVIISSKIDDHIICDFCGSIIFIGEITGV